MKPKEAKVVQAYKSRKLTVQDNYIKQRIGKQENKIIKSNRTNG